MAEFLIFLNLVLGRVDENGFGGVGSEPKLDWANYHYEIHQHQGAYDPAALGFPVWHFNTGSFVMVPREYRPRWDAR